MMATQNVTTSQHPESKLMLTHSFSEQNATEPSISSKHSALLVNVTGSHRRRHSAGSSLKCSFLPAIRRRSTHTSKCVRLSTRLYVCFLSILFLLTILQNICYTSVSSLVKPSHLQRSTSRQSAFVVFLRTTQFVDIQTEPVLTKFGAFVVDSDNWRFVNIY